MTKLQTCGIPIAYRPVETGGAGSIFMSAPSFSARRAGRYPSILRVATPKPQNPPTTK